MTPCRLISVSVVSEEFVVHIFRVVSLFLNESEDASKFLVAC